jgi:hypothetical protein
MKEIGLMIDDCIENGGTYCSINVDADASGFYENEDEEIELTETERKQWDMYFKLIEEKRNKCPHCKRGEYKSTVCEIDNQNKTPYKCANCTLFGEIVPEHYDIEL